MKIQFDTHLHSDFSTDSHTPLTEQVLRAKACGLMGICITDHMDYEFPSSALDHPVEGVPFWFDWSSYTEAVRTAKKLAPVTILTGVECGLQTVPEVKRKNKALRMQPELDYMIGSLHLVDRMDPYYSSFWAEKDPHICIRHYFECLYKNLEFYHDFDALGHLDYIVRYAPETYHYNPEDYRNIIEAILQFLIRKEIALELNTSGWKTEGRCQNPHQMILTWYRQLGGELITVGSDAHTPEYVAYKFNEAALLLKKTGLRQYVIYKKHKPVFLDL